MNMTMRATFPLFLLLTACGSGTEKPAANNAGAAAEATAADERESHVPELAGQWTITTIDGQPLDQVWPMHANVNEFMFRIESDCVMFAYDYMQKGNVVKFTPQPSQSCERVRSPAEQLIEEPIELANIVMFSNEGKEAQLSGPGGVVTMVRR